ncbi:Pycsar system effector family protein [Streptomyces luteolifulvus]|uniref:Pycsar system effector family protein n=1 Tax=Streptomyces luteolifulvus TaxID=2615112 RepID=UPI00178128C8|nr:Pycsar system effector family protein [Streptomyces luteolifulvus]
MTQSPPSTDTDNAVDAALADVRAEIGRAETTAGALLTGLGIPFAVLVATVPGKELETAAAVLLGIAGTGLVAAMLVVLLVVRPHFSGGPCGTYRLWAECTPLQVREDVTTDRRAELIIGLSQAAKRKYRGLRLSVDITTMSLTAMVIAMVLALT